jgi:hypothetical protein
MSVTGEENPIIVPGEQSRTVAIRVLAPASAFGTGKAAAQVLITTPQGFAARRPLTLMGPRHVEEHHDDGHDKTKEAH